MKPPHYFSPDDLLKYHQNTLEYMKKNLRNKVLCGQMKDTAATKLIAMQEFTVKMVQQKQPARQMKLGESKP